MPGDLIVTVIPNWNLRADLAACLDSLRQATYARHHVIVVDNASTDDSAAFVAASYPEVELIVLPENRGYAAALNVGIVRALELGAEYVFALNNDTVVPPDSLAALTQVMGSDPKIGIVAPKSLNYFHPERIFSLGDRRYRWLPLPVGYGYNWRDRPAFARLMEFDYVTGCAMLIRAAVFRQIGLFDDRFFLYYEDSDFCRRARDRGHRVLCAGAIIIYHKVSLSTNKNRAASLRIRARNRIRFYRRHRHGPAPIFTSVAIIIMAVWRVAMYGLARQGRLMDAYVRGLAEGWREPLTAPHYEWPATGAGEH